MQKARQETAGASARAAVLPERGQRFLLVLQAMLLLALYAAGVYGAIFALAWRAEPSAEPSAAGSRVERALRVVGPIVAAVAGACVVLLALSATAERHCCHSGCHCSRSCCYRTRQPAAKRSCGWRRQPAAAVHP